MHYEITRWFSFSLHLSLSHIYLHLYSQTLTGLYLYSNQIGDAGAQYLADALRDNKVILIFSSSSLSHIYLHLYSQTLTMLDLRSNQIGDAGAQYLADALRDNKVILIFSSSLSLISIFISIHRHSRYLYLFDGNKFPRHFKQQLQRKDNRLK